MVVISGLCAGTGLCGLRGATGGIVGRLRRMEVRCCFVGLAEGRWLGEMLGTAGGVSMIGASRSISVDDVSWEVDEMMVMAGGSGRASPVYIVALLAGSLVMFEGCGSGIVMASVAGISLIVPSTMAVAGGVSVVSVRLARALRLMMRAWSMRLRARECRARRGRGLRVISGNGVLAGGAPGGRLKREWDR